MAHTLLLVDDEEMLLYALARSLRKEPYQTLTARSAEEAISILQTHSVDLVISDEQMAGMSGGQLLAWVAEHCPEVVRIMLTGQATAATAIRAINAGAVYHFFTKPVSHAHLAITIRRALEHKDLLAKYRRLAEECEGHD
jgi:DNA-binding NtrC family response regulator